MGQVKVLCVLLNGVLNESLNAIDCWLCTQRAFNPSSCCFQVAKADLSTTEGKLAETTASLESVKADLTEKTRLTSQLESQVQIAQDKAADSRADAVAAQNNLDAAEHKVAELTDILSSAQASHSQAVDELQQQHVNDIRVSFARARAVHRMSLSCSLPTLVLFICLFTLRRLHERCQGWCSMLCCSMLCFACL